MEGVELFPICAAPGPARKGYPQLERFRAEAKTLSDIFGGVGLGRVNVAFRDTADLARGDAYTDNFFPTLGVTPQHGRLFAAGDDKTASTAVLSDGYRRRRFGAGILEDVRREVAAVDRNLPIFRVKTLRAQTEDSLLRERLLAMVSTFFGALALLLACVGLYGLMAYAVARRTGEIGIRMALGARREHIMWQVLRETLLLALAGVAIGVPLTLWTAQFAKALLFGVTTTDPLTIGVSIATLLAVAAIAGYLPARRAFRVDPMVALRHD